MRALGASGASIQDELENNLNEMPRGVDIRVTTLQGPPLRKNGISDREKPREVGRAALRVSHQVGPMRAKGLVEGTEERGAQLPLLCGGREATTGEAVSDSVGLTGDVLQHQFEGPSGLQRSAEAARQVGQTRQRAVATVGIGDSSVGVTPNADPLALPIRAKPGASNYESL